MIKKKQMNFINREIMMSKFGTKSGDSYVCKINKFVTNKQKGYEKISG